LEHPELTKRNSSKHHDKESHKKEHHHKEEQDNKVFVHEHDDHFHMHEHYHGGQGNIIVTTIGLVIHSLADGAALGATFYRIQILINRFYCS
jgi:zinc transporter ZupT